jgi:hypothetical protein
VSPNLPKKANKNILRVSALASKKGQIKKLFIPLNMYPLTVV